MSIEVQTAPKISQIALDRSGDPQFCLDDFGVITTKKVASKTKNITKNKEPISKDKIEDMASNYSDYYDSYDDDFEDASPERSISRTQQERLRRRSSYLSRDDTRSDITVTPPIRAKRNTDSRRNSLVSYRSSYGNSRATNKTSKKKSKKSQSASTRPPNKEEASSMVQRILSANRNKITKLYNTVEELQQEVDSLRQENKTLKRVNVKQEKEIKQIEKSEASLPQLLQRHSAELRTYRERLKKNKMDISRKERESHNNDVEITKLRDKVQYYKTLDNDKKLEERAALAKKLENVEKALAERDKRITDLQKTITLTEKARQREIREQQERHKKAAEELKKVREDVSVLKEKLKEKEKQLDVTNIYHLNIQRRLKKSNPLALPPVHQDDVHSKRELESTMPEKKRGNVFITNGPSETSSITAESGTVERQLKGEKSIESERKEEDVATRSLELEKLEAARFRETLEREARKQKDEEDAKKREEEMKREQEMELERMKKLQEEKKRQEEERKRWEEEKKRQEEEKKRWEEEKKRQEEEKRKQEEEMIRRKREEERLRKEKEEQERLKFKEDEETRRKKDLLLARMRAIDAQNTTKPNGIIDIDLETKSKDEKPKKLPIFLQSTEKSKETPAVHSDSNEKAKNGSSSSLRSKHSQSSTYDFKETIQNLHHGLPAHPSDQHFRSAGTKGQRDSLGDDELVFGSYKPSVGKRETKKPETFGSYNPSFGEPKKDTGLDFSRKQGRKFSSQDNDLVFGSYQPTFGGGSTKSSDVVDGSTKRGGRRGPDTLGQKTTSIFGDDLFSNKTSMKENKSATLFNEDSFNKSNDKSYPWENKLNVSKQAVDEGLLPRRPKIQQNLNKDHEQSVPAVRNALKDTIDDDIEEVTL